jgi:dTDP-glucose 4,6-dehydratase
MRVFVTGADGFIGSHLVERLLSDGHEVKALTYYNSFGSRGWLDTLPAQTISQVECIAGDVRDPHFMRHSMKGCEVVLHLAALIAIPFSYHAPDAYVDTNIKGTLNVLQAARDLGMNRVIHTSTSEVYGTAQYVPIPETHPLVGQSPYSASKIAADQMAIAFHRSFGLPVTIIRPFNTFGPRQSARAFIPTIITQVASGKAEVKVGSLAPTRDFNFVKDTARGFSCALKASGIAGETINLASRFEISMRDTAQLIAELMGRDLALKEEAERVRPGKSEVERLFGENEKAIRLLSWRPEYGGLEGFKRGLQETIDWFVQPENLRNYKADLYNL